MTEPAPEHAGQLLYQLLYGEVLQRRSAECTQRNASPDFSRNVGGGGVSISESACPARDNWTFLGFNDPDGKALRR